VQVRDLTRGCGGANFSVVATTKLGTVPRSIEALGHTHFVGAVHQAVVLRARQEHAPNRALRGELCARASQGRRVLQAICVEEKLVGHDLGSTHCQHVLILTSVGNS
jgi:hypothetical protein